MTDPQNKWQIASEAPASTQPSSSAPNNSQWQVASETPAPPANPYPIAEQDKGAAAGIARPIKGIAMLPSNIWNAFSGEPQDETEKASVGLLSKLPNISPKLALGLHRLILAPMLKEQEVAHAYDTIAKANYTPADWEKEPNRVKRAVKWMAGEFSGNDVANEANHKANMHRIASMVPLIGPMASGITEHYLQGDKSGAVAELLTSIATAKALDAAGGAAKAKLAPKTTKLGSVEVPVLNQSKVAKVTQAAAKSSGVSGEVALKTFAEQQNLAAQEGIGSVARDVTEKGVGELNDTVNPQTMSPKEYEAATDTKAILKKVDSFGDAAEQLRKAAKTKFTTIDEATEGEFSRLQEERSYLLKRMRNAADNSFDDLSSQLSDVAKREDALFDKVKLSAEDKMGLEAGRNAWRQANAMDELHSTIESSTSGANPKTPGLKTSSGETIKPTVKTINGKLLRDRINKMNPQTLSDAVGGNTAHAAAIEKIADLLAQTSNAAKTNILMKLVRVGGAVGGHFSPLGALKGELGAEGVSRMLGKVLTNPKAAQALATSLRVSAPASVAAEAIDRELQRK